MEVLRNILLTLGFWTYPVVAIELLLESSAFMGLILPGDSVVILMGILAATNVVSLWGSIILVVCSVFAGDVGGYLLGRYKGEAVLSKSRRAKREYDRHHDLIIQLQQRWGMWIVVIGRFMPFIRAVTPFTMGVGGLKLSRLLPAAAIAALAWSGGFFALGYEFGEHWRDLELYLKPAGGGLIGALVIGFAAWYWWRHLQRAGNCFTKAADWMRSHFVGARPR